ncbi:hypothetical protein GKR57_12750 [Providencia stuartii]|nr:hypothetical protein [Providencia stuartii]OMH50580.1 hypothetical protein BTZ17_16115 [Providencia stuartii]
MLDFISQYHIISITLGVLSAIFWVAAAFVKSKVSPNRVQLTFEDGRDPVDLHNFLLTTSKQARFNGIAAIFAASCAISQIFGI